MFGIRPVSTPQASTVQTLYINHHAWLHAWLRGKLGNDFDAADLAHDTFVRVMLAQRLPANLGDEPRALLTHIAKGLVIDHRRRLEVERAYLEALAHLPEPQAPSPEARMLILEVLCRIEAMLRTLPKRTRDIFLMAQLDGLTYQQIATQQGISLITVKRHMRTAFAACLALD
ncbi:RNA polymerase sigma-70 factor, ECF subfamily [Lampropedia hyalina DSM 16112]|uniref:RNA polymerase sigma-70 factor, ECF subfamily n=1 Tax=Lampropedia hyalina DSM 16112 TaxID=1122156 RepID=A0A1M5DTZ3_9BURK|nr:sigma-70 family RNA polymerase sigma factor [Lampropedia hyalina]SHF70395.1 RNA polymerase sigma-70 factor, ECF subfamily [Lampropedia hyalina DSM 16112]